MDPHSLFSLNDHLEALSQHGDPLEVLERTVDFEYFRSWLVEGLGYGDGSKGGRPPFDPVAMFKVLILQAQRNLSDARMEFMIRDRLSWMRFLGFSLGDRTPDENTIRHFRNRMTETGTLKRVMKAFDWQLHKKGYIPMSGQIVDASLVPAPKQRNTDGERDAIKAGQPADEIWPDEPAKAAQKDTDARWTLKIGGKVRYRPDGTPLPMIAIPVFGYKSHISINRRYGFIRAAAVTAASHPDGRMLRQVIDRQNTGSEVWADSAYRSQSNEAWLADRMLTSRIHRRKPKGKSMPIATARANAAKSSIRARIEHVFAHQKNRFGLFIRTIGITRAEAKLTLANLAYNFDRLVFHEKVRQNGRIVSVAVIVAVGVNSDGRREVLGMDIGPSEAEPFWTAFLRKLAWRGLRGVKLVISDAHEGIKAAVSKLLCASWQRCRVHFMRNALAHAGKSGRRVVSAFIATAFAQETAEAASQQWRAVADQIRAKLPKLATLTERIKALKARITAMSDEAEMPRRLQTMPGVGPITALAVETFAPPMDQFRRGRDFAAWLGLVPRQHSSGGKQRLGKTSKMGQRDIRRLLVTGAMAVVRWALRRGAPQNPWLERMLERKPPMVAAFALANKMARGIWAMLTRGEGYRDPVIVRAA